MVLSARVDGCCKMLRTASKSSRSILRDHCSVVKLARTIGTVAVGSQNIQSDTVSGGAATGVYAIQRRTELLSAATLPSSSLSSSSSTSTPSQIPRPPRHTPSPAMATPTSTTLYMPVVSPPTPAPSPGPSTPTHLPDQPHLSSFAALLPPPAFPDLPPHERRKFLASIIAQCSPDELVFISSTVTNLLRRDFLKDLPPELAVYVLGFIDEPSTLCRAACVSKYWSQLVKDEWLWKRLCAIHRFEPEQSLLRDHILNNPAPPSPGFDPFKSSGDASPYKLSYRKHFKSEYITGVLSLLSFIRLQP